MSGDTKNQEVRPHPFPESLLSCYQQPGEKVNLPWAKLVMRFGKAALEFHYRGRRRGRPLKLDQQAVQQAICKKVEDALIVERKLTRAVEAVAQEIGRSPSTVWRALKANKVRKNENRGEACPSVPHWQRILEAYLSKHQPTRMQRLEAYLFKARRVLRDAVRD